MHASSERRLGRILGGQSPEPANCTSLSPRVDLSVGEGRRTADATASSEKPVATKGSRGVARPPRAATSRDWTDVASSIRANPTRAKTVRAKDASVRPHRRADGVGPSQRGTRRGRRTRATSPGRTSKSACSCRPSRWSPRSPRARAMPRVTPSMTWWVVAVWNRPHEHRREGQGGDGGAGYDEDYPARAGDRRPAGGAPPPVLSPASTVWPATLSSSMLGSTPGADLKRRAHGRCCGSGGGLRAAPLRRPGGGEGGPPDRRAHAPPRRVRRRRRSRPGEA